MERNQLITYYFNRNDGEVIPSAHIEELEEVAHRRIFEMIQKGYHSGELFENISLTDDDPEDGVEYSGWWDVEEIEPKEDETEVPASPSVYIGPSLLEANLKCASGPIGTEMFIALQNMVNDWERVHGQIPNDHEAKVAIYKFENQSL
jgi:hypothetical protein